MCGRNHKTNARKFLFERGRAIIVALHYIRRFRFAMLLFGLAGCWQEIEYREPGQTVGATESIEAPQPAATAGTEQSEVVATNNVLDPEAATSQPAMTNTAAATGQAEVGDRYAAGTDADQPEAPETPPDSAPDATLEESAAGPPPTDAQSTPGATAVESAPVSPTQADHTAWMLGSRLSLAALANDRGIAPEDVPKWFAEAQQLAAELKVPVAPLPEKPVDAEDEAASKAVIAYLLDQEKAIGAELERSGGLEMSALFRLAMRSNLLLVLNTRGSKAVDTIARSIEALGPRTGLPTELWQPLSDMLKEQASPAAVRTAVRQMHTDVGRQLARAEQ
jgi:hypothetical protein